MRLKYISHSCFLIESGGKRIVFDPWICGTAYQNQWHLYPKPVNTQSVENADVILISHGHEDHFHSKSLKKIQRNAHVFFPFQWRAGVVDFLHSLNFNNVTEAIGFHTYDVAGIKITYLGYSLESVIVVECEGLVLVNINDALNSNHETAVSYLLKRIKNRWPKIDFLLSGWSGAGYFPNKVHYKQKNDVEVARIREQYFADNFCRFTKYLDPEIAIPFAPGFVLLQNENRWINDIKFPRRIVSNYYKENFDPSAEIKFPVMYPGDYLEDKQLIEDSPYHKYADDEAIYAEVDKVFKEEIEEVNKPTRLNDKDLEVIVSKLTSRMNENKKIYSKEVIQDAHFSVHLSDIPGAAFLNIYEESGDFHVKRSHTSDTNDRLIIKTKGDLLNKNLDRMWGGDLLSIGYGIDVEVFEERTLEKNLDIVCVRLISRYPIFKDDLMNHTGRVLKYYLRNPSLTHLWIKQKIKLRPYVNKYPFNERDHWITYNKCDLCKVCKIPELDFAKL
ncbi:MAG TPA: MBL fold metallo-hydrolase [Bacteroidia bacterium]|nr:MBL fold metallo-hydrolase [Bacteroidia bacterium]HNP98426.1 MBL fold metallo-hydrolase [Bacteroidia bacterium]